MKARVLCFGSSKGGDSAAFRVCDALKPKMKGIEWVKCASPVDLLAYTGEDHMFIMDAVKGLREVSVFRDTDEFMKIKSSTVHDMDLGTYLHVLNEMGNLSGISIIGIPLSGKTKPSDVADVLSSEIKLKEMG